MSLKKECRFFQGVMATIGLTGCAPGVTVCPLDGFMCPLERDVDPFKRMFILLESKGYSGRSV